MSDEDEIKDIEGIDEEKEADIDELVPLVIDDGESVEDETDEIIATEGFSPVEGAEGAVGEFDPEDPDAYLYNAPPVKYADSAEEDEGVWANEEEF